MRRVWREFCWGFSSFLRFAAFLVRGGCNRIFVNIARVVVSCGTGCTESPLEEVLALPGVDRTDSGLLDWLLKLLARMEECCVAQPGVRFVIARILAEMSLP